MTRPVFPRKEGSFLDKTAFRVPPSWTSKGLFDDWFNDLVASCGEFIGTVLFMLLSLGVSHSPNNNYPPLFAAFRNIGILPCRLDKVSGISWSSIKRTCPRPAPPRLSLLATSSCLSPLVLRCTQQVSSQNGLCRAHTSYHLVSVHWIHFQSFN